jgi:hypothetical protein
MAFALEKRPNPDWQEVHRNSLKKESTAKS